MLGIRVFVDGFLNRSWQAGPISRHELATTVFVVLRPFAAQLDIQTARSFTWGGVLNIDPVLVTGPQLDTALGWRHVVPKHRLTDWHPAVWIETNENRIAETIRTMVGLIARCDVAAMEAQGRKSRGA